MRYTITLTGMATEKKTDNNKCYRKVEKLESSHTSGRIVKDPTVPEVSLKVKPKFTIKPSDSTCSSTH